MCEPQTFGSYTCCGDVGVVNTVGAGAAYPKPLQVAAVALCRSAANGMSAGVS